MKKLNFYLLLTLLFTLTGSLFVNAQTNGVIKVEVKNTEHGWQLFRDGKPYFIKGAGGDKQMDKVVECGGNSVRTWGTDNAQKILDEAQKRGLTVMLGMWVQHERHGFDYDNKAKIQKQLEDFTAVVKKFKDHPALLMWGIGNEYDLNYKNIKVWDAVNDIAKMIHEIDPNHPTSTVTAGMDSMKVYYLKTKAPAVDIYGINTYGDIGNIKQNVRRFAWNGPYMITEWGPNGHWESPKTEWGTSVEQTSKEKAKVYYDRYQNYIAGDPEKCIGSYAFLWGFKQEYTGTWYGLFTEKGESTETVDALQLAWSEKKGTNSAPSLDSIFIDGKDKTKNIYLKSQDQFEATVYATDKENDKLKYYWLILPESSDLKTGGDAEAKPDEVAGLIKNKKSNKIIFRAPFVEGGYRLFVTVSDGVKVAYANIPFYVSPRTATDPPARMVNFKKETMDSFHNE